MFEGVHKISLKAWSCGNDNHHHQSKDEAEECADYIQSNILFGCMIFYTPVSNEQGPTSKAEYIGTAHIDAASKYGSFDICLYNTEKYPEINVKFCLHSEILDAIAYAKEMYTRDGIAEPEYQTFMESMRNRVSTLRQVLDEFEEKADAELLQLKFTSEYSSDDG